MRIIMKIIRSINLVHKKYKKKKLAFPAPKFFTSGFFYIEIITDEGIYGYGEISSYVDCKKIRSKIFKNIIPLIEKYNNNFYLIKEKLLKNLNIKKDETDYSVFSSFLQALLDIEGKQKNKNSFKLFRNYEKKIKLYASGGVSFEDQNYESLVEEMIQAKKNNFFGWKFRPSTPRLYVDHHLRLKKKPKIDLNKLILVCQKLRIKAGNKFKLMIDLGCRLKRDTQSIKFIEELNELNFFLIEEPFTPLFKNYSFFKERLNFSLGESFFDINKFVKFSKLNSIAYLQPDFNRIPIEKILDHQNKIKKIIIHNWTHSISFYSNINAALVLKNCNLIEYNTLKLPNDFYFLKKNFYIKNGYLTLKKKPGLGIEFIKNDSFHDKKTSFLKS